MFNESTRTMYDKNETIIQRVISEKPIRWITNSNTIYKSYQNTDRYNIDKDTDLRQNPTRLNYYNRYNRYTESPYTNLNLKPVQTESNLIHSLDTEQRQRKETDVIESSNLMNIDPNLYELQTQVFPSQMTLGGKSSRNEYRNIYLCPETIGS